MSQRHRYAHTKYSYTPGIVCVSGSDGRMPSKKSSGSGSRVTMNEVQRFKVIHSEFEAAASREKQATRYTVSGKHGWTYHVVHTSGGHGLLRWPTWYETGTRPVEC